MAEAWKDEKILWAHPKELAGKLWGGEVDLALVPVWEVLTRPGTRVLDGVAIGSKGEVRSVGVFSDRLLEECRSIRLTPHSVTSVRLWKLVAGHHGIDLPEAREGEARLLIGDEALEEWNRRKGNRVLDLGRAWTEWTGKPFLYAVWALGPKAKVGPAELERFRQNCRKGISRRGELARNEGERDYLINCIRYELGKEEREGMDEFAVLSGLKETEIRWV